MRKITALAFAWWYYDKWQEFKYQSDEYIYTLWAPNRDKIIQKIYNLADVCRGGGGENKDIQIIRFSTIPFFLITAHPKRDYIFKEIFTTFWIHNVGIIERDIYTILCNHNEHGYNKEQINKNSKTLDMVDYRNLRESVNELHSNGWNLFNFSCEDCVSLAIGNSVWMERSLGYMFIPENKKDMELLCSSKSAISGNLEFLQMY